MCLLGIDDSCVLDPRARFLQATPATGWNAPARWLGARMLGGRSDLFLSRAFTPSLTRRKKSKKIDLGCNHGTHQR